MGTIDELSPLEVAAERIKLSPEDPLVAARAHQPYAIAVDYALCDPEGVALPLELTVTSPSSTKTTLFRRVAPSVLTVVPDEGGRWVVALRERFHNRWWGSHAFAVEGDQL